MSGIILLAVVAGVALILGFFVVGMYNRLVRLRVNCQNGLAQIDVQLKRRYDLIPNLVETVKGYASHESETLEAVIRARTQAVNIDTSSLGSVAEASKAESALTGALSRLFALAEAYPDLKANTNFLELQEELASTENKISFARQHYNDSVAQYDTALQSFPSNIVAGVFNFERAEYFEIENPAAREAPKVSFTD